MRKLPSIFWMLMAVFFFAIFDALVKYLAGYYPVLSLVWARYLLHALIIFILFFPKQGLGLIRTKKPMLQLLRGALMLGVSLCMMNGALYLPLAELTAIYFMAPLIATILSPVLLGERVTTSAWVAVIFGFIGVLMIARPGEGVLNPSSLLPLLAAILYALFQILTRKFSQTENPIATNFMTGLIGAVLMTAAIPMEAPGNWAIPTYNHFILILALGVSGFLAQQLLIKAFEKVSPAELAPFGFTQLIWATGIGFFVFDNTPSAATWTGMGIIALSGLYVLLQKKQAEIDD